MPEAMQTVGLLRRRAAVSQLWHIGQSPGNWHNRICRHYRSGLRCCAGPVAIGRADWFGSIGIWRIGGPVGTNRRPYTINISAVDENGKLDASYANPRTLPFQKLPATEMRSGYSLNCVLADTAVRHIHSVTMLQATP